MIRYLKNTKHGEIIASDIFVSSIRAVEKLSVNEAIVIGEELINEIFSIGAIRRMIMLYLSDNNANRAADLLDKLPQSEWNIRIQAKIKTIQDQNKSLLDKKNNKSKFFNLIKPISKKKKYPNITMA